MAANNVSHHLHSSLLLIFFLLLILASHHLIQGAAVSSRSPFILPSRRESHSQGGGKRWVDKNPRRLALHSNPESLDLSQPRSLGGGSKLLNGVDANLNLESPDLSQSRSLGGGGKLLDVFQPSKGFSKNPRRLMIGSVAPTCTYNECKGCKYKCRAEQVPVEGNDPINSPYHYKCVCHR